VQPGVPECGTALAYCRRRKHLRRTLKTGLIVGVILTLINLRDKLGTKSRVHKGERPAVSGGHKPVAA